MDWKIQHFAIIIAFNKYAESYDNYCYWNHDNTLEDFAKCEALQKSSSHIYTLRTYCQVRLLISKKASSNSIEDDVDFFLQINDSVLTAKVLRKTSRSCMKLLYLIIFFGYRLSTEFCK